MSSLIEGQRRWARGQTCDCSQCFFGKPSKIEESRPSIPLLLVCRQGSSQGGARALSGLLARRPCSCPRCSTHTSSWPRSRGCSQAGRSASNRQGRIPRRPRRWRAAARPSEYSKSEYSDRSSPRHLPKGRACGDSRREPLRLRGAPPAAAQVS